MMLSQSTTGQQAILEEVFEKHPVILHSAANRLYLLINDLGSELEKLIYTGETDTTELHVFNNKNDKELLAKWRRLGLIVRYRSQRMEYMWRTVTLIYPQIINPANKTNICLIPWFTLPGRPYPVFVYIYSIWHYNSAGRKSLWQSAKAAGEVFGIKSFNKSTVSRNDKAIARFVQTIDISTPISAEERAAITASELYETIPTILSNDAPAKELAGSFGVLASAIPERVNRQNKVNMALGNIPCEYADVIKPETVNAASPGDARKRPPAADRKRHVQRAPNFAGHIKILEIRTGFIEICRRIILNAAAGRHRFMILPL